MSRVYVLATANPGKVKEMREILFGLGIEVRTREELGIDIDVEETGSTFLENATLKARAICKVAGLPAIADDSGLVVDALGGAPGVNTSSYGGESLDNVGRYNYLLKMMKNMEHRSAKFVCNIVCVFPDGSILAAEGECCGEITAKPRGNSGFGYDPVFLVSGTDMTMAELTPDEKNTVSHRGAALRKFAALLDCRSVTSNKG
jgi:XTP/dITP diphosphohydrolase